MLLAKALQNAAKLVKTPTLMRGFAMQTKNEPHTIKVNDVPISPSPIHETKTQADIKAAAQSDTPHQSSKNIHIETEGELRGNNEKLFDNSTHFGFSDVSPKEKQGLVNEVFHSVANSYDIMNDVMSLGIHRVWKDQFVEEIGYLSQRREQQGDKLVEKPTTILDVAGGTGDIAFRIFEKHNKRAHHFGQPDLQIKVLDINTSMLKVGADRARKLGYDHAIEFVEGNAESLSLPDNSVDLYTIAFGIRNVPRIELALSEAHRVLKKGGRFLCMEFSKVENPLFSQLYGFYNFNIIPLMGQAIAGDKESYQYLAESIEKFPDQETFMAMIEDAGFEYATYKNYTNGIVAVHSGFKI
jgi:ubiquinone/menaquinone biosynthesis methyltransferase